MRIRIQTLEGVVNIILNGVVFIYVYDYIPHNYDNGILLRYICELE